MINIQRFGGRGASSSTGKTTKIKQNIKFSEIKVGDKFKYNGTNGITYNFEVTRDDGDTYVVQAMSQVKDGKTTALFGPSNITTLHNDTQRGGASFLRTSDWERKSTSSGKYNLDYWKKQGVKIKNSVPKGWVKREGSTTAPKGYSWYSNGKSLFSGEYKHMLVKDKKKK